MANTGHFWGAWAFVQETASDWSADDLTDGSTLTSDPITGMDQKSACLLSFAFYEDNTGAISGDMDIWILGDAGQGVYEETTIGKPFKVSITPVQNDTVYYLLPVDVVAYNDFKVAVKNNSGQTIAVTVKIRFADIPVAS